ncbi:MAG: hypothetical protein AAF666_14960 [Pseudomonadota bacterium]
MKIMICGGFDEAEIESGHETLMPDFVAQLAKSVIEQGHDLRCSNISSLDAKVIEAGIEAVSVTDHPLDERVVSYVPRGKNARVPLGEVNESSIEDWNSMNIRRPTVPEPIRQADVLIIVGGFGDATGTYAASNWAKQAGVPILPIGTFGMASRDILEDLEDPSEERKVTGLSSEDLRKLSRAPAMLGTADSLIEYATQIVSLAEKAALSRDVFLIMSFAETDDMRDYKAAIESVCRRAGFEAIRTDSLPADNTHLIIDEIHDSIESCGFIVADLTHERPNVYYEIGYARGLGKKVILTSKAGTEVHFDLQGFNRIVWSGSENLKDQISPIIKNIAADFGISPK